MKPKLFLIIKDRSERVKRKNFRLIHGIPLHEYFISQRNDYINRILTEFDNNGEVSDRNRFLKLKSKMRNISNSEKIYEEFDKMFVQVYPKFYKKLSALAKLSQTDLRLASYIKMNHTNNEISRISGVPLRTVETQRYRLKKKLKLNKEEDLNSYLKKL